MSQIFRIIVETEVLIIIDSKTFYYFHFCLGNNFFCKNKLKLNYHKAIKGLYNEKDANIEKSSADEESNVSNKRKRKKMEKNNVPKGFVREDRLICDDVDELLIKEESTVAWIMGKD